MSASRPRAPEAARTAAHGLDLDRVGPPESAWRRARRRLGGRYPVDAFGADPLLQDVVAPVVERVLGVEVEGGERIPASGPAVLVTRQRVGFGDPLVVQAAVRRERGRRARVVGYPDVPGVSGLARRLGAVRAKGEDLAVVLRAGHLAIVPLGASRRPAHAGPPRVPVLWGAIGFPVLPVVVRGAGLGPAALPLGGHRLVVGEPVEVDAVSRDPLSAAELAEASRSAVQSLLDASGRP